MSNQSCFFCSIIQPILHNVTYPAFYTLKHCVCVPVSSSLRLRYISVTLLPLSPLTKALVVMFACAHPLVLHMKRKVRLAIGHFALLLHTMIAVFPQFKASKYSTQFMVKASSLFYSSQNSFCFCSCSTTIK